MADRNWTCPRCNRTFRNRHQWHSCIEMDLEEHLAGHTPHSVRLYEAFQAAVEQCGDFRIHPQKTRIAFITTMTFAGARLARQWIDVSFIAATWWDDDRVRKLELFGPTSFGHTIRVSRFDELDQSLRARLCDAWRRGNQETLDPHAPVQLVTGHARSVLEVPLATRVVADGGALLLKLPRYAVEALGEGPVSGRVAGREADASVDGDVLSFTGDLLRRHGLGDGDPCDVTIRPV